MSDQYDRVQTWLHERMCGPQDGCAGPAHHRQQAIEVILIAEDPVREGLRSDVCGTAMRYVDTKEASAFRDLEKATNEWRAWYYGEPTRD